MPQTQLRLLRQCWALGTLVTITLWITPDRQTEAETALDRLERQLFSFGVDAWGWGEGALAQFNRALMQGERVAIPTSLRPLFERAWQLRQQAEGLFEPRIAALVQCWGFDRSTQLQPQVPTAPQIEHHLNNLRTAPDWDGDSEYGPAPGVGWDFGAIGKGYCQAQLLDQLAAQGFADACLDLGGNLAVRGKAGERPWRIGIRDPRSSSASVIAQLIAADEVIMTHADDQRYFVQDNRRYAHLLDPRTGWPARGLRSVTVVHPEAEVADALGAALFVAGEGEWQRYARQFDLTQVLVLTESGQWHCTPALATRLNWSATDPLHIALGTNGKGC